MNCCNSCYTVGHSPRPSLLYTLACTDMGCMHTNSASTDTNLQAFCHKARCVVSKSTSQKLTPFHKEDDTQSAFFVADVEDLFDVDFSEYQTIFVNLIDVSTCYCMHLYLSAEMVQDRKFCVFRPIHRNIKH